MISRLFGMAEVEVVSGDMESALSQIRDSIEEQAVQLNAAVSSLTLSPEQYQQLHELIETTTMPSEHLQLLALILDSQVQHIRLAMSALAIPAEQLERLRNLLRGRDK